MQTPRYSAPVSSHRVPNPTGKWVASLGLQWPQAGLQAGTLSALAPHRANLRNLGQSSACEWVRWSVWSQQTATQSFSRAWQCRPSNSTCLFISKQGQWQLHQVFWESKPLIMLSKCQHPFPLLPNHEWSCALDLGQKSPKGLWVLGLWSETSPWDVNTYLRALLSPKGSFLPFDMC